ncbi:uncharacterized protein CEXT_769461 [Caerostris extrusa]|uniref:Uncharacterized protein n=1 Tax=Caerostris extrusa TaxID=172846 RepID=A0AAV4PWH8_CAEEX|nr:uncharacterized protein CEXT_769461 [Caerostris extrusa]
MGNIGTRKIDLSGIDGKSHDASHHVVKRLYPISRPGKNGEPGKPGLPGDCGGAVFGIGERFVNGANLTIISNGGMGGPGQKGKNGEKGDNAYNGSPPRLYYQKLEDIFFYNNKTTIDGFKFEEVEVEGYDARGKGGDGGNGGKGGKGGKPGNVAVVEFGDSSGVSISIREGNYGEDGKGGIGGRGGANGGDTTARGYFRRPLFPWRSSESDAIWWVTKGFDENNTYAPSGKNGTDGANISGMQNPEDAMVLDGLETTINEYKTFLRQNLVDRFKKSYLDPFLNQMNDSDEINRIYKTSGLITELEGIEQQFNKLKGDVDFVPLYQSLLNRISSYARNPDKNETSLQYKKVLNYLYTTVLGRIYNLKEDTSSNLIINIGAYLDLVKKDVDKLKDLQNSAYKAEIINRYKANYKSGVDKKIEEAKSLIQKQITPEIDNISNQIDGKINTLIKETIELQKRAEQEREALIRKKEELERALTLKGVFSGFKIFGQIISFLGPVGAVVGTAIGATTSVAESLVLNKQQQQFSPQRTPGLVPDLNELADRVKNVKNQKIVYLNNLLEEISQEANENPEELGDMSVKISEIKGRLSELSERKFRYEEFTKFEIEIEQELSAKEQDLKSQKDIAEQKKTKAIAMITKFNQGVKLGSMFVDIYNQNKNDEANIDALNDAIGQAENKIQKLKQYEANIYDTVIPMLQDMEETLHDTANKLDNKSRVTLDVVKWQVQGTLRDIKLQMQQVTDGFKVKDNLARCIEKLEEVMTTLISVYDHIQNYHEQENLASYVADISSAAASKINISEPILVNSVNHLEMLISSNLVLQQYKTAVSAFKQWVFPFADNYLDTSMLPSHLEMEQTIENLVTKAIAKLDDMKLKVDLYKTTVKKTDKYLQNGEFSSRYSSTEPFFVWRNQEYKSIISNLLSGQEVVLIADVKDSAPDKDAIKFSLIEFYFKSKNDTVQSEINKALKGFDIRATHTGNSYYRYDSELYIITSEGQSIWYSCEKNIAGEPVRKNAVFDKIKEGDLMLSPYTLWRVKIRNSTQHVSFQQLVLYKDDIDLELSGYGSYVNREVDMFSQMHSGYKRTEIRHNFTEPELKSINGNNFQFSSHIQYEDYLTNGASTGISSPINYLFNFLKVYLTSNLIFSANRLLTSKEENARNIDVEDTYQDENSETFPKTTDLPVASHIRQKQAIDVDSADADLLKNENEPTTSKILMGNFKSNNNCVISFLLGSPQDQHYNQTIQVPELNYSLLLADLITRSVTKNKYKFAIDESLLSPQEILLRRINDGIIRNEKEIKEALQNLLSSSDEDNKSSWFGGMKHCVKSAFQWLGWVKKEDVDDYVMDVKTLFVS